MKYKYSVIIPIYNSDKYLEKCICSILSQTYNNFELILVNDGSIDNSLFICEKFKNKDSRVIVLNKNNGGVSSARNYGLAHATGDYITFVDADDYIESNTIEEINNVIEKNNVDIVKYNYITEIGLAKRKYQFSIKTSEVITKKDFDKFVYRYIFTTNDTLNVWNAFIKSSIAKSVLFDINLKYAEDSKFMFECIDLADSIFVLDKYMYHYIQNSNSAVNTTNYNKKIIQLENVMKVNIFIYQKINNKHFLNVFEKRIFNAFLECLIYNPNIKNRKTYDKELKKIFEEESVIKETKKISDISNINMYEHLIKMDRIVLNKKIKMKIKKYIKKILVDK